MRRSVLLLLLPLALPAITARADAPGNARVISVIGSASARGQAVSAGASLAPGSTLDVGRGAVVQLLFGDHLSAGIAGPTRVQLSSQQAHVVVHDEGGAIRLCGANGLLRTGGWSVALGARGAAVMLHGGALYGLRGEAMVRLSMLGAGKLSGVGRLLGLTGQGTIAPTFKQLGAGQVMRLAGIGNSMQASPGAAPPRVQQLTARYAPPAPWRPRVGQVSTADVRQARRWMQRERQAQRETAACGCTEGGGAQGEHLGGKGLEGSTAEQKHAVVRVRVVGVPRKK